MLYVFVLLKGWLSVEYIVVDFLFLYCLWCYESLKILFCIIMWLNNKLSVGWFILFFFV